MLVDMTKSLGLHVLEKICSKTLTIPTLANAMGMPLAEFEVALRDNLRKMGGLTTIDEKEFWRRLVLLSEYALKIGNKLAITQEQGLAWVDAYDEAPKGERETITKVDYKGLPPAWTDSEVSNLTHLEWIVGRKAFTLEAYKNAFPRVDSHTDALRGFGWWPSPEQVEGVFKSIWRWNPLHLSKPPGRPATSIFQLAPPTPDMAEYMRHRNLLKTRDAIIAVSQRIGDPHFFDAKEVYFEKFQSSPTQRGLDKLETTLKILGYEYNEFRKLWGMPLEPKAVGSTARRAVWARKALTAMYLAKKYETTTREMVWEIYGRHTTSGNIVQWVREAIQEVGWSRSGQKWVPAGWVPS
jgi:hypothetical protein